MEKWILIYTIISVSPPVATSQQVEFNQVGDCIMAQSKVIEWMKPPGGTVLAFCLRKRGAE